jgi:hypothetical protein
MDTLLTSLGLLLIATILTLLVLTPRSWLVALSHGFGIQGLIGACAAAVQVGFVLPDSSLMPIWDRVHFAVKGIPFLTAGWTGRTAYDAALIGPTGAPAQHLDQFLPIVAIQMSLIAGIVAVRKMRQSDSVDYFYGLLIVGLIVNAYMSLKTPWWG